MGRKQSPETIAKRAASIAAWRAANPEANAARQAKCAAKLKAFTKTPEFAAQSSERMKRRHADPEWQKVRDARSSRTMKANWQKHRDAFTAAAVERYGRNIALGVGINSSEVEARKRIASKWIMTNAMAALHAETDFDEVWNDVLARLRREIPYDGPLEGSDYMDYLAKLGKLVTADPAIRELSDGFMATAIPRFAEQWNAQGMETRRAKTEGLGAKHDSPVAESDAPVSQRLTTPAQMETS